MHRLAAALASTLAIVLTVSACSAAPATKPLLESTPSVALVAPEDWMNFELPRSELSAEGREARATFAANTIIREHAIGEAYATITMAAAMNTFCDELDNGGTPEGGLIAVALGHPRFRDEDAPIAEVAFGATTYLCVEHLPVFDQ